MAESMQFFVDNFNLQISEKSMIVFVREMDIDPPRCDKLADLPDWIFRSALTIWFKEGETNIYHRALAGEKIKNQLRSSKNL